MAWLSLRAYAKHRACALSAVQRAIASGRLQPPAIAKDGQGHWKVTDAAAADAQWQANTHGEKAPIAVQMREAARAAPPAPPRPPPGDDPLEEVSPLEARVRLDLAKAQIAELELAERKGELVETEAMKVHLADVLTRVRARLLGIPVRAKQQLPHLNVSDIGSLDTLVREALEELTSELEATGTVKSQDQEAAVA